MIIIKPLYILLLKMRGHTKTFGGDTHTHVLIDDKLLEKYNTIWDKVSNSIKKEFDSEPNL